MIINILNDKVWMRAIPLCIEPIKLEPAPKIIDMVTPYLEERKVIQDIQPLHLPSTEDEIYKFQKQAFNNIKCYVNIPASYLCGTSYTYNTLGSGTFTSTATSNVTIPWAWITWTTS